MRERARVRGVVSILHTKALVPTLPALESQKPARIAHGLAHDPQLAAIDEDDEKSEEFVLKHTQLLSEHATGFYLLHCINLQAEKKTREMKKMARQYLLLTYVCDLAKSMPGRDARDAGVGA